MNYIIIEDEPLIAGDLETDLLSLRPAWHCVKKLGSVRQAMQYLPHVLGVDLIFSDIQLGDGNCFDVFSIHPPKAPVIFCTAFDQYALQAFSSNGIAYLLKPYGLEALRAAVEKWETLRPAAPDIEVLLRAIGTRDRAEPLPQRIIVHHRDKLIPVPIEEVALFYTHHEQTMMLRMDGQRLGLPQSLGELESTLGSTFFRASRQHLVQRSAIVDAAQFFGRKLLLNLNVSFDEQVTVSKEKVASFLEWWTS